LTSPPLNQRTAMNQTTEALHKVRVTRPSGLCHRLDHYEAGDVIEVTADDAIELFRAGAVQVLEPSRLGELPEPDAPVPDPEPFATDPRIRVKALRSIFWHSRSFDKGQEVDLPERIACKHIVLGTAKPMRDSQFSDRGMKFIRALRAIPGERDFQGFNPSY
jgi:hypothetical protein